MATVRFVQLTDTHIAADPSPQHGVDTTESFRRVAAAVSAEREAPDFVLLSGDCVNDGRPESYEVLRDLLPALPAPVHVMMGNHDERAPLRRVLLGAAPDTTPYCYRFDVNGTAVLVLDSWEAGSVAGRVDDAQLAWLAQELRGARDGAVVCVHHPPVPVGVDWLDRLRLQNGTDLLAVLRDARVRLCVCGHVHRPFETTVGGLPIVTTPSTCYQFGPDPPAKYLPGPAGYRVVELDDGEIRTEVRTV